MRLVDLVVAGRFDASNRRHLRALRDGELLDDPRFVQLRRLAGRYRMVEQAGMRGEAAGLAQAFERTAREFPSVRRCALCGGELPAQDGPGRPRRYCTTCTPPGDRAAAGRAYRSANPEAVAARNLERREGPFSIACSDCGQTFLAARRAIQTRCTLCRPRHRRSVRAAAARARRRSRRAAEAAS